MHLEPFVRGGDHERFKRCPELLAILALSCALVLAGCDGAGGGGGDAGADVDADAGVDDDGAGEGGAKPLDNNRFADLGGGEGATTPVTDDRPGLAVRFPANLPTAQLDSVWLADIDLYQYAPHSILSGDVDVALMRHDVAIGFDAHVDRLEWSLDKCIVHDLEVGGGVGGGEFRERDGERRVSGGDVLTLWSAGGTWLDAPFDNADAAYVGDDVFPEPMPAELRLSLPGAEFPAVDAWPLVVPSAPRRLSPVIGELVTPASEYRWVPDGTAGTSVRLSFRSSVAGQVQGFPIVCRVVDDGEFTLPDEALAEVERREGELDLRFTRDARRLEYRDGVVLYQKVSVADD